MVVPCYMILRCCIVEVHGTPIQYCGGIWVGVRVRIRVRVRV